MKLITSTALALIMATTAAPAIGQASGTISYGANDRFLPTPQSAAKSVMGAPKQDQPQSHGKSSSKQQQANVQPSKKAMKALLELQDAVNKNDSANIPGKLAAAQAVAQTKEDRYLIGELQLKAALAANNNTAMGAAIDAVAASGYNDAAANSDLYERLGSTLINAGQYSAAVTAFEKAAAADPKNWHSVALLGEALFAQGQKDQAVNAFQRSIQASAAAGSKPDENLYKRAVGIAYEAKSSAAPELARAWVAAYPSPGSWSDAIAIYRNYNLSDAETTIDLLRLKLAMGTLATGEYGLLAQKAAEELVLGEARSVIDAGIVAKKVDPASSEFRDLVGAIKARPRPSGADLALAMKAAVNAKALMRIGDNYAALGDTANAVAAYKAAMAKPDGDAALANLHIGMALAQSDKGGAAAAFNAVTGPRAGIAKYWLTYLAQKA